MHKLSRYKIASVLIGGIPGLRRRQKEQFLRSRAILVLGNGRSGTSVLTRCLSYAGAELGEGKLLGPNRRRNPKGYFENTRIIDLHKKIGGKIRYRPAATGYERSIKIMPIRRELTDYLRHEFADRPLWVVKDPRMNDYLALWKAVLQELGVEPHFVIMIRNPLDVLHSYKRAGWGTDRTWSLRQWQIRTLLSLHDTFGKKRVIVPYEELSAQPLKCLHRIFATLELPWTADDAKLQQQIDRFIDPNYMHSGSGFFREQFLQSDAIGDDVKELYLFVRDAAQSQSELNLPAFHAEVVRLYRAYLRDYGPLYRDPPRQKATGKEDRPK